LDFTWLAASGVLIGIFIFALKVSLGCGLASLSRKETLCIATSYLFLSLVMGLALGLVPESATQSVMSMGVAMHLAISLLLVAMGVATAREWNRHGHDLSRKTFWILSVPCPACLAATFLSCSALAGLLEVAGWKVGVVVGLIFFASIAVLSTTVGKMGKAPSTLGNAMIFVGLFYLLSILLIPAYLKTQSTPFVPVTIPASDLFISYFFILGLVILGFVGRRMGVFL
jgi:predicted transporter